jgi:glycosyltransferase involved in cell wall biosynthesis
MRILHLANHCRPGNGNVHVAVDLACRQAENGHTVAFASGDGAYVNLLHDRGVQYQNIPHGRAGVARNIRSLAQALIFCRNFKPDVIHAHMMAGAVIGAICSKVCGAPLITTVHNSFDPHSFLMRLGDRIVAVSAAERDALSARGFPKAKIDVVLNGTEGSLRESALAIDDEITLMRPCVLTAAGLHRRKGIDVLIKAFSAASAINPSWHLYIVGDGPDRTSLEELARHVEASARIHFLGFRNQPNLVLKQTDIFSLASHVEPFGLVLCEARNAGCAIVATAAGGIPEVLDFGSAGRLVPPADAVTMSQALCDLMQNPNALAEARRGAKHGSEFFSVERMAADYDEVYNRELRSRVSAASSLKISYNRQE